MSSHSNSLPVYALPLHAARISGWQFPKLRHPGAFIAIRTDCGRFKCLLDSFCTERVELINGLRAEGIEPYATSYARTHTAAQLQQLYAELPAGQETADVVRVCGRISNERNGWMFVDLTDSSGRIQLFFHSQSLPEARLARLRRLRRGDFIGVCGTVRRTARGELSVRGTELTILSLGLTALPGRRDEFNDPDERQRNRP